mmetsp:Transcript_29382/g.69883  ORF Transcript_29382/g.69883 Transcript_29382/m.69883 type:complete len:1241 (+) Transcript_29382:412-4134(+)
MVHTYPSMKYSFDSFWKNWKRMMLNGVPTGSPGTGSGPGAEGKFVLFAGDDQERHFNITLDPRRKRDPKRQVRVFGFEYGLANMAAFLSQAMVDGIHDDECNELNEQTFTVGAEITRPISNACGQWGLSYADLACDPDEKEFECKQLPLQKTISASFSSANRKKAMKCGPIGTYREERDEEANQLNRTNVQGCCWWGRGPLHTRGPCATGKLNHYLGAKAFDDGRISLSTPGTYADVNFCVTPEAICLGNDEDMMWSVAMFKWAETVQRYSSRNDKTGETWDFKEELVKFVNGGMNTFEYYSEKTFTDVDNVFIHKLSAVSNQGCHDLPECSPFINVTVPNLGERRTAFTIALSALQIPTMRHELNVEQALGHLIERKGTIEANILAYRTSNGFSKSLRYKFDELINALLRVSRPEWGTDILFPKEWSYFNSPDHPLFYMGDPFMKDGYKYGLANIALFLGNGLELSIDKDEACDELNEHAVSEKLPISNSCGQRGLSYQSLTCELACPVEDDMFITAVTFDREIGSPPPLECGPRFRIPSTGYWDPITLEESEDVTYANENGRIDVEGCCWWGRGFLKTKGPCSFGRLNHYIGKGAVDEGRDALFPGLDFCSNPEAVCGSPYAHQTIWLSGLFEWIDRVQTYNRNGFDFMKTLHEYADVHGFIETDIVRGVGAIVKVGCHNPPCIDAGCQDFPCDGASPFNEGLVVTKTRRTIYLLELPQTFSLTEGGSHSPTPAPSICFGEDCTDVPTLEPFEAVGSPTKIPIFVESTSPSAAPTSEDDARLARYNDMAMYLQSKRKAISSMIFKGVTYSLSGLLFAMKDLATTGLGDDLFFYIGQDDDFDLGLANVAVFFAHAMTRGLATDTCEEINVDHVDGKLPLSNSCGQHGKSYNDEICELSDIGKECLVDPQQTVHAISDSDLPPMHCSPKEVDPLSGFFDMEQNRIISNVPFPSDIKRLDTEGCCWWGRGILHTRGPCNIGKFNFHFGLPAFVDGRPTGRFPIDFCSNPESLCVSYTPPATEFNRFPTTIETGEVKYLIGMTDWIERVQSFNWGYWNYKERLKLFVDGGFHDETFMDGLNELVLDSIHDAEERNANLKIVLDVLFNEAPTTSTTAKPTQKPNSWVMSWTYEPTTRYDDAGGNVPRPSPVFFPTTSPDVAQSEGQISSPQPGYDTLLPPIDPSLDPGNPPTGFQEERPDQPFSVTIKVPPDPLSPANAALSPTCNLFILDVSLFLAILLILA